MATCVRHLLLVLSQLLLLADVSTIDLRNQNLTAIPWDLIATDDPDFAVEENRISSVTGVPTDLSIEIARFQYNQLKQFPDLRNISRTLRVLYIGWNPIREIWPLYLLSELTELTVLGLTGADLVILPHVSSLPAKLDWIEMKHMQFLTTLPNMCLLNNSQRTGEALQLNLGGSNNYTCDSRMLWAKLGYEVGLMSIDRGTRAPLSYPTCDEPRHHGLSLQNVTIADLMVKDGAVSSRLFRRFRGSLREFPCRPAVLREVRPQSKVSCGLACLDLGTCALFATDGGRCVLTEFTEGVIGDKEQFLAYKEWYMMD